MCVSPFMVFLQGLSSSIQDPLYLVLVKLVYSIDPACILVRVAYHVYGLLAAICWPGKERELFCWACGSC